MKAPKVSVLMPVHNGEEYIKEAILSILNQTFTDFEFIIINDGSTDKSVEIIESFKDKRIKLVHNEKNLMLVESLNKGISLSKGEYIARMDCDDISLPERLERQVNFMKKNPNIGVLGTACEHIDKNGDKTGKTFKTQTNSQVIKLLLCFYSPIIHPSVLMRKELLLQVNCYTSDTIFGREKYSGEDYDLWRRISNKTEISNLEEKLILIRKHDKNVTVTYLKEHLINSTNISKRIISEYINEEIPFETVFFLRHKNVKTVDQLDLATNLLLKIYRSTSKAGGLSSENKKLIKEYIGKRIFKITRPVITYTKAWKNIFLVLKLNPFYVINYPFRIFLKTLKVGQNKLT